MNSKSSEQLLIEIENYSRTQNLLKKEVARRLDIPYSTFKKWFHKGKIKRIPSQMYLDKIQNFLESQRKREQYWEELWTKILKWWETQHRYSSVQEFANEIGWETKSLSYHIQNMEMPPRVILEKISKILGLGIPALDSNLQNPLSKAEKVKYLLILLEDELRWFRDTSEENRNVLRETLDFADVGYISSLLTMIADESRFQRWSALTTNRFNYFRKKGGNQK
jgi:transposase